MLSKDSRFLNMCLLTDILGGGFKTLSLKGRRTGFLIKIFYIVYRDNLTKFVRIE